MRRTDIDRLSQPYADRADIEKSDPTDVIGVQTPRWRQLEDTILEDLAVDAPYGVGWWAPHPGTSRRILISDHLYACATSVATNLTEAGLHWLEFLDALDVEDQFQADAVRIVAGEPQLKARPRRSPLESLYPDVIRLHEVGVVRALSGALDCVAGAIIGVLAIPQNILKADLGRVLGHFSDPRNGNPTTEGQRFQMECGARLQGLIAEAGPAGWLEWLLAYRNMLVHRGRRIEVGQFVPREPLLFGADGRVIPRVKVVRHAPREPLRSDIDVLRQPNLAPVLTEDAQQTPQGGIGSVRCLVDALGAELSAAWGCRKARPLLLTQPEAQWPRVDPSGPPALFPGYRPGSYAYAPGQLMGHPASWRRLQAAALFDHQRAQWSDFD